MTLSLPIDPQANELLARSPLALFLGMAGPAGALTMETSRAQGAD